MLGATLPLLGPASSEWVELMVELDDLRIPSATRRHVAEIVAITDALCSTVLDAEYAGLCRQGAAKLARKRPSPLSRGNLRIWAAGVVYAVGQVNFLFDPTQQPHVTADRLSELLGVKKATMAGKAKLIRDILKMGFFSPDFLRSYLVDNSPLVWLVEINGMVVDARTLPLPHPGQGASLRLIPYVPLLREMPAGSP
jgi:hypothetical protein